MDRMYIPIHDLYAKERGRVGICPSNPKRGRKFCQFTPTLWHHARGDYALTVPHIRENPQEYEVLLSNTFANRENVFDSTVASKWDRMKVIHCKKQDGTCIEKIEEVFSWLKDGIREK